ncbi:MAG: ABC transporter ATP-binding protein [Planctomycetes bacterium]|nr:ABC transporter ATP-binding protein [Planctomycetota bacterium]
MTMGLAPPAAAAGIELADVAKAWRGGAALQGVSLAVPAGTVVGLVGPSGAGKTTLMRIALGLLEPDRGSARVLGVSAAAIARHSGRVGLLLDGAALEPGLTVADNLALHALRHGRGRVDAGPLLERLGLRPLVGRRAGRLSQGEAIRVALARALLLEPAVLVLDEPVAHLDPALASTALDLCLEAARTRGAAVLVSSHQLAELQRVADRLVLLHRGKLLLDGEMAELLATIAPAVRVVARPAEAARAVLARRPEVRGVTVLRIDGVEALRVEIAAAGQAAALNAALHAAGVAVDAIAPERPTLEELFRRTLAAAGAGR